MLKIEIKLEDLNVIDLLHVLELQGVPEEDRILMAVDIFRAIGEELTVEARRMLFETNWPKKLS
jgi:hypothetical protein